MSPVREFSPEDLVNAWKAAWTKTSKPKPVGGKYSYFIDMVHMGFDQSFLDEKFLGEVGNLMSAQDFWKLRQSVEEVASAWADEITLPGGKTTKYFVETFVIPVAGRAEDISNMISAEDGAGIIPEAMARSGFCGSGSMVLLVSGSFAPGMLSAFSPLDIFRLSGYVRDAYFDRKNQTDHLNKMHDQIADLIEKCPNSEMPDFGDHKSGDVHYLMGVSVRPVRDGMDHSGLTKARKSRDVLPIFAKWDTLIGKASDKYKVIFSMPTPWDMASECVASTMFNHQLAALTHKVISVETIRDLMVFCQFLPDGLHFTLFHEEEYLGKIGIPMEVIKYSTREILRSLDAVFNIEFMMPDETLPAARVH